MKIGKWILAGLFITSGTLHFVRTDLFMKIMPPYIPEPRLVVLASGACEIAGAAGLLIPATRRLAAWGLMALLVAVLPANVQMAFDHANWPRVPAWLLWARIPLQLPLIWWARLYSR